MGGGAGAARYKRSEAIGAGKHPSRAAALPSQEGEEAEAEVCLGSAISTLHGLARARARTGRRTGTPRCCIKCGLKSNANRSNASPELRIAEHSEKTAPIQRRTSIALWQLYPVRWGRFRRPC